MTQDQEERSWIVGSLKNYVDQRPVDLRALYDRALEYLEKHLDRRVDELDELDELNELNPAERSLPG
jgi:hypothetical protein